jgi:sulfatase modifying factor 1
LQFCGFSYLFVLPIADFARFITETAYSTENEAFGWSFVFHSAVSVSIKQGIEQAVLGAEWWLPVNGSTWREPEGPGSDVTVTSRLDYPVVQVTWNDATKYCQWRNARLPTEAEWEIAASGPHRRNKKKLPRFPWGNELEPNQTHRMNIYHGEFPNHNTADDGYEYTAPVGAFGPQNEYGLYNMLGNVWEWVQDWWSVDHAFKENHDEILVNPSGPAGGKEKVKKGGSFLCHRSYCYRYRLSSRFQSTPDSAASNIGFRCARSALLDKDEL